MEKNTLFLIVFMFFISSNFLSAQERVIEKELNGKSYIAIENTIYKYNKNLQILQDSINDEKNWQGKRPEYSNVDITADFRTFLRSVFTKERIEELRGNNLSVVLLVDNQGKILEFKFFLLKAPDVSIKDIHVLAKALRKKELFQSRQKERGEREVEIWNMPVKFDEL